MFRGFQLSSGRAEGRGSTERWQGWVTRPKAGVSKDGCLRFGLSGSKGWWEAEGERRRRLARGEATP